MSDTARDYQTIEPATTEGLEDFFEPQVGQAQVEAQVAQDQAHDEAHVTIAEAAVMLGIDRRYALRLAHKGKLRGFQDDKDQWFIRVDSIKDRLGQAQGKAHVKVVLAQVEAQVAQDQAHDEAQGPAQHSSTLDAERLLKDLEAATYRIGYLEAQLEAERQQVKLLTDSQHKAAWWHKFRSWFFGQ